MNLYQPYSLSSQKKQETPRRPLIRKLCNNELNDAEVNENQVGLEPYSKFKSMSTQTDGIDLNHAETNKENTSSEGVEVQTEFLLFCFILIGVAPNGMVTFVSRLWGGNVSNRHNSQHDGFLPKLSPGDVVMADKGFTIEDLLPADIGLNVPPRVSTKYQMSFKDFFKPQILHPQG
ncbi:unnamed protein product [Mytilus coruscus]|uniref:DDE Tnp4 domain-containing protein n=1 Tax=Mytilus coruscus TaxID=42192 RepID=A0A6J8EIR6_MYTCO|nr:unnamed protein product [Mytilus coruscus]